MNRLTKNICAVFGAAVTVGTAMYLATRPVTYPKEERTDRALQDEVSRLFIKKGYQLGVASMLGKGPGETVIFQGLRRNGGIFVGEAVCEPREPCRVRGEISPIAP